MTVLVHFQDENGHPFTALTCTTVTLKEKGDPGILSTAAPLSMNDDGLLRYEIRNMRPHPRQVRLDPSASMGVHLHKALDGY